MLSVALTPDGHWVLSGSKDRGVQFWDPTTGHAQLMLQGHKNSGKCGPIDTAIDTALCLCQHPASSIQHQSDRHMPTLHVWLRYTSRSTTPHVLGVISISVSLASLHNSHSRPCFHHTKRRSTDNFLKQSSLWPPAPQASSSRQDPAT